MHGSGPEDYFYGFPALPGSGLVKVASEQYVDATHVSDRLRGLPAAAA